VADENNAQATEAAEGGEEEAVTKKIDAVVGSGGPNQKLIFIVLILNSVVLLVVAALIAMSYMKQAKQVSLADVATSTEEHASPAHGGEHGGGHDDGHGGGKKDKKDEASNFIKESFTVNLADSRGAHFAKVDVEIEVEDDNVKQALAAIQPKIRDFIVIVLSSKTYEQVSSADGRDFLREEIRNKINGYLPRGQIKDVYFTQFIVQ
jgi:flagellar FliL protein